MILFAMTMKTIGYVVDTYSDDILLYFDTIHLDQ